MEFEKLHIREDEQQSINANAGQNNTILNKSSIDYKDDSPRVVENIPKLSEEEQEALTQWQRSEECRIGLLNMLNEAQTKNEPAPARKELGKGLLEMISKLSKEQDDPNQLQNTKECKIDLAKLLNETQTENGPLPTRKELEKRFASSFKPFIERFKKEIIFEISDSTQFGAVPRNLKVLSNIIAERIKTASFSLSTQLTDSEKDESKKVSLELAKIEVTIFDENNPEFSSDAQGSGFANGVDETEMRDYHDLGTVTNPGIGDEWIVVKSYDEYNERELHVRFKIHLQVPIQW